MRTQILVRWSDSKKKIHSPLTLGKINTGAFFLEQAPRTGQVTRVRTLSGHGRQLVWSPVPRHVPIRRHATRVVMRSQTGHARTHVTTGSKSRYYRFVNACVWVKKIRGGDEFELRWVVTRQPWQHKRQLTSWPNDRSRTGCGFKKFAWFEHCLQGQWLAS